MSKKLTVDAIHEEFNKEFGETRTVQLSRGYSITIPSKFRDSVIEEFILNFLDVLVRLNARDDIEAKLTKDYKWIAYMLMVRHFTDLDIIPLEIDTMIVVGKELNDIGREPNGKGIGLLTEIVNSFDQTEIDKIDVKIKEAFNNNKRFGPKFAEMQMQIFNKENGQG